tara:strand:- start:899 stop:3826 length:2928 start_codon:yes stop_codon:yes gene_type:complete
MSNFISNIFSKGTDTELKHLKSALNEAVTSEDKKKSKRIMNKIVRVQLFRFHNTIDLWKTGIDNFENTTYPTNEELIRVYNDAVLDAHLTALMESRKKKTTGSEFKIVNDELEEIDDQTALLKNQWFTDAMSAALDSIFFGFSLIQFGDRIGNDFKSIKVVPREFVYPQKEIVRSSPTSDTGVEWKKYAQWLVPAGRECDLGLLVKASPLTIYKKSAMGAWADYTDLFGTPLRVGKTDVRDNETRNNMADMLDNMASSTWAVVDREDEVEFVQGKNVDAYETFNAQIERLNSELSKLLLGSTMTMDDGSSRSQSEVHEHTTNQIAKSDSVMVENWVNKTFIPWLNHYHGFGITGKFMFDTTEVLTVSEQFERDLELIKTGAYNIPAAYITETYGIPVDEIEVDENPPPNDPEGTKNELPGKLKGETTGFNRFAEEINNLYTNTCCAADEPEEDEPQLLTDAETEQLYRDIFNEEITPDNLPVNLYENTAAVLASGMEVGINDYEKLSLGFVPDPAFYDALKDNAFKFAGAKTFQQTLDMSDAIVDENGKKRTWPQFRREVDKINDQYNKNWLRAEFNAATGGAQMASKWQDIAADADLFPYLKYKAVRDARTRDEHKALDGIVRPTNDPFWNTYYPTNGWNCRCDVIMLDDSHGDEVNELKDFDVPELAPEFEMNQGRQKIIYSPDHPYFVIENQFKPAVASVIKKGNPGKVLEPKATKELKGWEGKHVHGKLTGEELKDQQRLEQFVKMKIPDALIKKQKRGIKPKSDQRAWYESMDNHISFAKSKSTWNPNTKETDYKRKSVIAHELGHGMHLNTGEVLSNRKSSVEFRAVKRTMETEMVSIARKEFGEDVNISRKGVFTYLSNEIKAEKQALNDKFVDKIMKKEFSTPKKGMEALSNVRHELMSLEDTIGGMSRGTLDLGYLGHSEHYYGINGDAEIFAHFSENFFVGNDSFKKYLPKTYEASKKYIENLTK